MKGPLNGIRVLAVESFIAGPMASMWLADAGAEVVKIESPTGGDTARNVPPMMGEGNDSQSLSFIRANRNKRSVTLDLKSPDGRETFLALLGKADIFMGNANPAALPRLGLTYAELSRHNPRLSTAPSRVSGCPSSTRAVCRTSRRSTSWRRRWPDCCYDRKARRRGRSIPATRWPTSSHRPMRSRRCIKRCSIASVPARARTSTSRCSTARSR